MGFKQDLSTDQQKRKTTIRAYGKSELANLVGVSVWTLNNDFLRLGIDMKYIKTIHPKYVKLYFENYGTPE